MMLTKVHAQVLIVYSSIKSHTLFQGSRVWYVSTKVGRLPPARSTKKRAVGMTNDETNDDDDDDDDVRLFVSRQRS